LLAGVVTSDATGFVVQTKFEITKESEAVFDALLKVGSWWENSHTFFGDARKMSIDPKAGGCFCETGSDGRSVRHLEVVFVDPGKSIRFQGGLGPLQEQAVTGSMTISLEEVAGGTLLQLTYRVGGYRPGGLEQWAPAVDGVLSTQMRRLKKFAETGSPD